MFVIFFSFVRFILKPLCAEFNVIKTSFRLFRCLEHYNTVLVSRFTSVLFGDTVLNVVKHDIILSGLPGCMDVLMGQGGVAGAGSEVLIWSCWLESVVGFCSNSVSGVESVLLCVLVCKKEKQSDRVQLPEVTGLTTCAVARDEALGGWIHCFHQEIVPARNSPLKPQTVGFTFLFGGFLDFRERERERARLAVSPCFQSL